MAENQNIIIHNCASAREGRPSHGLARGPQEAEDSKERVKKSVSSTSVELPFKGQISNNTPGWSKVSHRVMVDTKGLGPAYLC